MLWFNSPVRFHDSHQPLPERARVFDENADVTAALLCSGPEHSEEHQDGNDHTRLTTPHMHNTTHPV